MILSLAAEIGGHTLISWYAEAKREQTEEQLPKSSKHLILTERVTKDHSKIRPACNKFTVCNFPATFLPYATFLQHYLQHAVFCNLSATHAGISCNTHCLQHCLQHCLPHGHDHYINIAIVCNTSFHQTPFEDALSAGDSNSKAH